MPDRFIMTPLVTVVIPVLFDTDVVARLLSQIPDVPSIEVVVVDGDQDPRLDHIVAIHRRSRLRRAPAGRGRQMNAGAEGAAGVSGFCSFTRTR